MPWISKVITILLCGSLLLGTTGCAYNSKNPLARDISYGATYGAAPGLLMLGIAGAADDDDDESYDKTQKEKEDENNYFLISLAVLGGGMLLGAAIGTIVGIVDLIAQGTHSSTTELPDEIKAPSENP